MKIQKIILEIPCCHDIVTAETSKSRKPKFLRRHDRFGDITEREIDENVIIPKCTQKHGKEQEECMSFAPKKVDQI
jgi:hypothetical protein